MAIKYKGEVELTDSTGRTFVLRLGQFQIVSNNKRLAGLSPREYQTHIFQIALVAGAESQKDLMLADAQKNLTLEDAAELIDDVGYKKLEDAISQTRFYRNINEAAETEKAVAAAAAGRAAATLTPKIQAMREGVTDPAALSILDELEKDIAGMQKPEGNANPTETTITSS